MQRTSSRAGRSRRPHRSAIPTSRRCARRIRASCFPWKRWQQAGVGPGSRRPRSRAGRPGSGDHGLGVTCSGSDSATRLRHRRGLAVRRRHRGRRHRLPAPLAAGEGRRRRRPRPRHADRLLGDAHGRLDPAGTGMPISTPSVGRAAARGRGRKAAGEESPGSTETRCRVTPGGGDPRESATESKPPRRSRAGGARVKGWGKSPPRRPATGAAWQTPPGARPNRDGAGRRPQARFRACRPGRLREASGNGRPRGMAVARRKPPYRTRLTGRLASLGRRRPETGGGAARFGACPGPDPGLTANRSRKGSRRYQQYFASASFSARFALRSDRFFGSAR